MNYEKNKEAKYNHFYFENEHIMLIGVNKDIEEEEASLFAGRPLQVYEDFAGDIVQLKDLKDREALFTAVDEFLSQQKKKKEFHGVYWDIFLDFLLSEKDKTLYDMSVALSRVIPGNYEAKSLYDKLEKLKTGKGNPHDETLKLVELVCYYMGVTKEIVETGEGIWYIFEDDSKYTMKKIYEYCKEKWSQNQEIILDDMIRDITGVGDGKIGAAPIRIWVRERTIDEKTKKFIVNLIKQMDKK